MVSVIVLMVSPPWGQSWRLAALSLLTINLSDQVVMLYFLHTELSMNLLEYSICNRPSAWPAGRGLLIQSRSRCWRQIRGSAGPFAPWAINSDSLFVKLCLKLILIYIYKSKKSTSIGSKSDYCLPLSLTHWLTHSCLVDLIDVTLDFEDANSKLLDVFKVADVDAEDMLTTVCLRFWSISLVEILKWNFGRDSETEFQSTCDLKAVTLVRALTPWVRVPLSMFYSQLQRPHDEYFAQLFWTQECQ